MLSLIIMLLAFESYSQSLWVVKKDKNGVQVYLRDTAGSEYKSFKGTMKIQASLSEIVDILKKVEDYRQWFAFTKTSKLLKKEDNIQFVYIETSFPWPYKNRDMVYQMEFETINITTTRILLKGISGYIPKKKGILRMKKSEGYLLLNSKGSTTEITYVFHSEPEGNIPVWLVNKSVIDFPYKTLINLKEMFLK